MRSSPHKRKLLLLSVALMLFSLACLCTGGLDLGSITGLLEENAPEEVTILEEPQPQPQPIASGALPGGTASSNTTLEVIDTNYYEDDFGTYYFLMLVENTGSVGLEFVEGRVTLKDAAGNIVAEESFFSTVSLIQPGTRAPISVYWSDGVPAWETFEIFVEGDEESEFFGYYTDLAITSSELVEDDFGGFEIVGEVQNTGGQATDFVSIVAILYDANGRIIGEEFTYAEDDVLQPGDSSPFTVYVFTTAGDVASYDLIADGSEYNE